MQLSQQTDHMLLFYQQCIALFLPIASGYQVSHLSDAISVDAKASTQQGRDLTHSYDKSPYTHRKIYKATWQHKNATKLIFHNDWLGRSGGATTATPVVWLNRFTSAQLSH